MRPGGWKRPIVGRLIRWLASGVVAWLVGSPAWAGPPLISDDPFTIGRGRVEAILAFQTAGQPGSDVIDAPVVDLTLGLVDRLDFTLVAGPAYFSDASGEFTTSGNVVAGLKWQPIGTERLAVSLTPALGANVLSTDNFFFYLPAQIEYAFGRGSIGADVGYQFVRSDVDGWNASVYGTWQAVPSLQVLGEVWALPSPVVDGADFGAGVGIDWAPRTYLSLLAMVGTGIGSTGAERVDWVGYIGLQWRFRLFGKPAPQEPVSRAGLGGSSLGARRVAPTSSRSPFARPRGW